MRQRARNEQWSPTPEQWSPVGSRRPLTLRRAVPVLGVAVGPLFIAVLWGLGLLSPWVALALGVVALAGGAGLTLPGRLPRSGAPGPESGGFVPGARVLVVGGGYAGLLAARALQSRRRAGRQGRHQTLATTRRREPTPVGSITVVDPHPHMTYQPFLPEAAGGALDARNLTVGLRQVLDGCDVLTGSVVAVDDARRRAVVRMPGGELREVVYDVLVVAPGAVARELPVPGLADIAHTVRTAADATALRTHVLSRLDAASSTADPQRRCRLLTFAVIGGGFAGLEVLGELEAMAARAVRRHPALDPDEVRWLLVEAGPRIMPEVDGPLAARVHGRLARRGVEVRVGTTTTSAVGGRLVLSDGTTVDTDTVVLAAGTRPNPLLERTDLPLDAAGRVRCSPMLQVDGRPHVFTAGDCAAVPDLARGAALAPAPGAVPAATTAPTAQHAVRQARLLARNVVAFLGHRPLQPYRHTHAGSVAGLGRRWGVAEIRRVRLTGWPAYALHRAYHWWAVPTVDRKLRILVDWAVAAVLGRDHVAVSAGSAPAAEPASAAAEPAPGPAPVPDDREPHPSGPVLSAPRTGRHAPTGTAAR